jgi:superfamily II DNA or RNA helicase
MLLRPRQKELVNRAVAALQQHGNTLAVAPTGSGKTVMLSAVIGEISKAAPIKACVVAHRDELTAQNEARFRQVNPHLSTSIFNASIKSWQPTVGPLPIVGPLPLIGSLPTVGSPGNTTFAMIQTLSRDNNLATMPSLDLLVIDEAHHARSESYLRVISHARSLNPHIKLLGMTATPNRGDKKGLRPVFSNVCDQITVRELIASGHLVPPKMFVMDVGTRQKLKEVKKRADDYSMEEVAQIMDTRPINEAVVAHWKEKAGDRQTVVFCSTVEHAHNVQKCFINAGVFAVLVHGEMSHSEREQVLKAYTTGENGYKAQVIVNVGVLLEGWDDPLTSCVVLLRPSSYKSTFIQMVGRGLRTVNPEEHPGVVKNDCIVLDFGTATLMHGSIEQSVKLDGSVSGLTPNHTANGVAPVKTCPDCQAVLPAAVSECPLCGFVFESTPNESSAVLDEEDFTMMEIDIFDRSPFLWVNVDEQKRSFMATGFNAWSSVFFKGQWHAVGGLHKQPATVLATGKKSICFAAADDWMNFHETDDTAHKMRGWLNLPATDKQLQYLPEYQNEDSLTRYKASALMNLKFNAWRINNALSDNTLPVRTTV